jgi:hypothetical protein
MTKANTTESATEFAVLLYPPHGRPRVVEIPTGLQGMSVATYATRTDAEAALETFLKENPEYRNWVDGRLTPPHGA